MAAVTLVSRTGGDLIFYNISLSEKCLVKHPQQYSDLFLSDYGWETSQTPLGATSDLCEDLRC